MGKGGLPGTEDEEDGEGGADIVAGPTDDDDVDALVNASPTGSQVALDEDRMFGQEDRLLGGIQSFIDGKVESLRKEV